VIDRAGADAELLARTGRFLAAAQIATATGGSPARVAAFDGAESLALAFCGVALDGACPCRGIRSLIDRQFARHVAFGDGSKLHSPARTRKSIRRRHWMIN